MTQTPPQLAGDIPGACDDEGKTMVVGVKMDGQSRELLTWSLVKVAQSGDRVIALHVLPSNEIVDQDGKSLLLSLVKAFDSVLGVYEGFCNLKQVDLKLKICRGKSIRKIIVREANSYAASKVIVGTASRHHTIWSSTSVAKYCARKLPKDCSILAVRNGKIVFQREASAFTAKSTKNLKGANDHRENGISGEFQQSSTSDSKLNDGNINMNPKVECDGGTSGDLEQAVLKQKCIICTPDSISSGNSRSWADKVEEPGDNDHEESSMALVPLEKLEASSRSVSLSVKELSELQPGWPLLRRMVLSARDDSGASSSHDISVVKWTTLLPNRFDMSSSYSSSTEQNCDQQEYDRSYDSDHQNDAIVPFGTETFSHRTSLDHGSRSPPRELEGLHDKYSSTCRLFKYQELQSATSNFKPGSKKDPVTFGWNERYKVAVGVAEALHYLHNHSFQPVIHRDVKSSNILLAEDFEPQLSDFGLSKRASNPSRITCTDVAGTFGYLAPEYFMYGKVTDKIDVYAYGVVLLELLSGRKPISSEQPKGQESLVMWAKPILNGGKLSKLLDPCMGSNYNHEQMERMVLAATLCTRQAPRARPHMSLIVKLLQGDGDITRWARLQVNASDHGERLDEDGLPRPDIQSHLSLALLDVEDDSLSISSIDQHVSLEDYLRGRWSRSASFD